MSENNAEQAIENEEEEGANDAPPLEGDTGLESTLKENARRFATSALRVYNEKDYTSATILYFKALFAVLDLVILKKKGLVPKDHSERFRILEKELPEQYAFVDAHFSVYQDTYRAKTAQEDCDAIKLYVEKCIAEQGV